MENQLWITWRSFNMCHAAILQISKLWNIQLSQKRVSIVRYFQIYIFKICNKLPHLFDYYDNYPSIVHIIE